MDETDDMDGAGPASEAAFMVDLTPGALTAIDAAGQTEQFESIGELLQHLLDRYRTLDRTSEGAGGDFMEIGQGYNEKHSPGQRDPTEADRASARRV